VVVSEYLGHSQIVTLCTAVGSMLRAKVGVEVPAQRGDRVGLAFDAAAVSLFDQQSGRALALDRSAQPLPLSEAVHG
jgi:multiple sugar transport system ATP-binding protein